MVLASVRQSSGTTPVPRISMISEKTVLIVIGLRAQYLNSDNRDCQPWPSLSKVYSSLCYCCRGLHTAVSCQQPCSSDMVKIVLRGSIFANLEGQFETRKTREISGGGCAFVGLRNIFVALFFHPSFFGQDPNHTHQEGFRQVLRCCGCA